MFNLLSLRFLLNPLKFIESLITFGIDSGSGGGNTTTSTTTNIPDWLKPETQQMLAGATKQLFEVNKKGEITGVRPYTPYSTNVTDYYAGFSPMQQQSFAQAAQMQMPGQYAQATDFANAAGYGGLQSAQQALGYGNAGFQSGQLGQQMGLMAANIAANQAAQDRAAAQGYGNAGFQSGQLGQQFGLQSAQESQALSDMYGSAGYQAGLQGQQSGLLGQQFGLQSAQNAQNMAQGYGAMGAGYGAQAANLAGAAQNYGARGAGYGDLASQLGLQGLQAQQYGMDVGQQARDYAAQAAAAGQNYGNMVTNQGLVNQYMSPYQQAVTDVAKQGALRDFQVAQQMRQSQAARSGAYGGARQAIENAEAQRNLNTQLQALQTQGSQNAYNQALANIAQQQNLGLQGLQGAQSGLGTALQGGQLGLSGLAQAISGQNAAMQGQQVGLGGVNAANQAYQTGIQGANTGLSSVGQYINAGQLGLAGTAQGIQGAQSAMQGAGVGLSGVGQRTNAGQLGLAGTAQGIQGAQAGLQGVNASTNAGQFGLQGAQVGLQGTGQGMQGAGYGMQGAQGAQAGYGLANQSAQNLSGIGTAQQAAQKDIISLQNQLGAQQQAQEQKYIDAAIANYANAQNAPMNAFNQLNALIRGMGGTQTQYAPPPSVGSQAAGLGTALGSAYMMTKKEGGKIEEPKTYKSGGLVDLAIVQAMGEA